VYALATIRGGGEFGDEWHKGGNLANKQNVFDDFAACMTKLVELKYTNPAKLVIEGGSNGGLLMGAMITQHPEKFRACLSHVGIYDMLRVELSSNGEFNTTEFGTVKDKTLFEAMYSYSPYHRIKDGTAYPSILMMTGANDPRVDPMQSRKMVARLQAVSKSPVLLRTSANAGHGIGSSLAQVIERHTDRYAFLFRELGMTVK
jgi:prolyl oligopeptidase